jgi:chromosome segregation ATPase
VEGFDTHMDRAMSAHLLVKSERTELAGELCVANETIAKLRAQNELDRKDWERALAESESLRDFLRGELNETQARFEAAQRELNRLATQNQPGPSSNSSELAELRKELSNILYNVYLRLECCLEGNPKQMAIIGCEKEKCLRLAKGP